MSAPAGDRPVFNDRYEIHSRIGRGGMADVFLARDLLLDRPVAVKVLFPEFATDPTFVERFRREAQAAANLNHPNIVGVYDWGAGARHLLHRHGVRRRAEPGRHPPHRGRRSPPSRRPRSPPTWPPPSASPTATASSTATSSRQHPHRHQRHGEGGRLRHRPGHQRRDRGEPHPDRRGHGHRHLLLARAGPGPRRSTPAATSTPSASCIYEMRHGPAAVQRRQPGRDRLQAGARGAVAAAPGRARCAGRATRPSPRHLLAKNPVQRYSSADDVRLDLRRFREGGTVQADAPTGIAPAVVGAAALAAAPAVGATTAMAATPLPTAAQPAGAYGNGYDEPPPSKGWLVAGIILLLGALADRWLAALPGPRRRQHGPGVAALGAGPAHRRGQADRHPARPRAGRGGAADGRLRARHRLRAVAAARPGRRGVGGAAGVQPGRRAGRPAQPRRHDPAGGRAGARHARAGAAGDAPGGRQPARGHRARPGPWPRQGRQGPHRDPGGVERAGPGGRAQRRQPRPGRRRPPSSPRPASRWRPCRSRATRCPRAR